MRIGLAEVAQATRRLASGRRMNIRAVATLAVSLVLLVPGCTAGTTAHDGKTPPMFTPGKHQSESPASTLGVVSERPAPATRAAQIAIVSAGDDPAQGPKLSGSSSQIRVEATTGSNDAPTVEDILEQGYGLAGTSPAHLAIRGTPAAGSVRCAWRGIARTVAQRNDAVRFWLRLGPTDPIPDAAYVETLFAVVLDTLNPEYRETAKANFLAIARGGLSTEYLFLTCFADYAVTHYLLGSGPRTVTVAYDPMGEAASYDLYVREHDAGTYGTAARQTRGAYEAGLQAQVVAAEQALSARIGGRDSVVFLAPMAAHHAIAFEAWQAVAQWAVVTDDKGVAQAVRDDTPAGDPEHTQTLANLTSRIKTAAAKDTFATTRIANVTGLQADYQRRGAYGDISLVDIPNRRLFQPAQPPAAPTCTNGTVIPTPNANRGLVRDCEALLAAKDTLRGTAALNWSAATALSSWDGVTTSGTPSRVTGLSLPSKSLTGTIPPAIGQLLALTTLNLSANRLTGALPAELGWLVQLTELRLSGNQLTGCMPSALRTVATNDFGSLNLRFCDVPAPANLTAGTPTSTRIALSWAAVTGASAYRVESRVSDGGAWITDSDAITGTTHTVDDLTCGTSYQFRVSAYGSGGASTAGWSAPSAPVTASTSACTPVTFGTASYAFSIHENAPVGRLVGTVAATGAADIPLTYTITAGNDAGAFAIDRGSGRLTVAAALDRATTAAYTVTVTAGNAEGSTATATVTIAVTAPATDYDADGDGLIDVANLAQLNAIRWDLDGDGASTDPGYAAAFPAPVAGMGCPASGCLGYELTTDLDFDTDGDGAVDADDTYWNDGYGWAPIGDNRGDFGATFEGNGHTIANLFINRSFAAGVALFEAAGPSSVVRRVRLRDVAVTGDTAVAALVGYSKGTVHASAASGRVQGRNRFAGGLVGWHTGTVSASTASVAVQGKESTGGIVGTNYGGTVAASYASGTVTGATATGGLVGLNSGTITASYTTGAVTGTTSTGGLAGQNFSRITASYATGAVTGTTHTGGLVGENADRVTASYWDTATSGQSSSGGGAGKTTSALQTPTAATGIYATWNVDLDGDGTGDHPWNFGTASQYPVLQMDIDGDGTATWREFGTQRPNHAPVFTDGATTTREVAENTAAGENIGLPVTATDADGDSLTYALGGTDAAAFDLDPTNGQLKTKAALDYETTTTYTVTVAVSDGYGGTATTTVTIRVTDVADTGPLPANLVAGTSGLTSIGLSWDAVPNARTYRVAYRVTGTDTWIQEADALTGTFDIVDGLTCGTAYEVRVLAYGDGPTDATGWSTASATVTTQTTPCPSTAFGAASYAFTVSEDATVGTVVGTVAATGTSVTYTITAGNDAGAFAIGQSTGELTVAGDLDYETTAAYTLTVQASADGATATATVTISVTEVVETPLPAPAAPTALAAGTVTATSVPLTWAAVTGAAAYRVEYRASGTEAWTTADASLTATAHTVAALECATAYEFRVSAYGDGVTLAAAWGAAATPVTATTSACPLPAPAAPTTLAAGTVTATSVPLTWAAVTGAATYRVEYRASGTEAWTTADASLTAAAHTVAELTCATAYEFRVSAYGDGVTLAAAWGAAATPVTATTSACPLPAPAAPVLTGSVASASVMVRWGRIAGATTYQLRYREAGAEWPATATDLGSAGRGRQRGFRVRDLAATRTYHVQVRAHGNGTTHTAGWGAWSAELIATTGQPPAPTGLTVGTTTGQSVALSWTAIPGAASYQVRYRSAGGGAWTTAPDTTAASLTVSGLQPGTTYVFRVRAKGDGARYLDERRGPWSSTVNGTTAS